MKVSILYFGVPRNTAVCLPTIHNCIIEPLRSAGFSVIEQCHLFMQSEVNNTRSKESGRLSSSNYHYFRGLNGIIESADINEFDGQLEHFRLFGDAWEDGYRSTRNLLMQFHSLKQVTMQFEKTDADFALFVRPDIFYAERISPNMLARWSKSSNHIAVPPWQWHNGLNDRIAVCSRSAAFAYGYRGDHALAYCQQLNKPLHAERFLSHAMQSANAKVRVLDMRADRVRIDGRHERENFDFYATAGGRKAKIRLSWALARSGFLDQVRLSQIPRKEGNL